MGGALIGDDLQRPPRNPCPSRLTPGRWPRPQWAASTSGTRCLGGGLFGGRPAVAGHKRSRGHGDRRRGNCHGSPIAGTSQDGWTTHGRRSRCIAHRWRGTHRVGTRHMMPATRPMRFAVRHCYHYTVRPTAEPPAAGREHVRAGNRRGPAYACRPRADQTVTDNRPTGRFDRRADHLHQQNWHRNITRTRRAGGERAWLRPPEEVIVDWPDSGPGGRQDRRRPRRPRTIWTRSRSSAASHAILDADPGVPGPMYDLGDPPGIDWLPTTPRH